MAGKRITVSLDGDENLSKISAKVSGGIMQRIRNAIMTHPYSSAKAICSHLKIDYDKYKRTVYTEKSRIKEILSTKVLGQPLGPPEHRVEFAFPLDAISVIQLCAEAGKNVRDKGVWYRVRNRNRQIEYHDEFVTVRVFPKSCSCRILMGKPMGLDCFRRYVERAFFMGGLDAKKCEEIAEKYVHSENVAFRHRTFLVGRVDPFKIDFYKPSLGLTILADRSHSNHIEAIENAPAWISFLIDSNEEYAESTRELAKQIETHLSVMKGIGKEVNNLGKAVGCLNEILSLFERKAGLWSRNKERSNR